MANCDDGVDAAAEAAFTKRLDDMLSNTFITSVIGLAKELGLFETMASFSEPKTLECIGTTAAIKQRYLQEIFKVLVPGGIVEADDDGKLFYLKKEYRKALTSKARDAVNTAWCAMRLFSTYEEVLNCCKLSGPKGIPYDSIRPVDYWMKVMGRLRYELFSRSLIHAVPQLPALLESGISVLELGSGEGGLIAYMAKLYPKSTFLGTDYNVEPSEGTLNRLENLKFEKANVENLPDSWKAKFDWIFMVDVIHDLPYPRQALTEIKKIIKPTGYLSFIDISITSDPAEQMKNSANSTWFTMSLFRCLPAGLNFDHSEAEGVGLGMEKIISLVSETGFNHLSTSKVEELPLFTAFGFSVSE